MKVISVMSIYNLNSIYSCKSLATFSESQSAFGYIFHHFYNDIWCNIYEYDSVTGSNMEVPS